MSSLRQINFSQRTYDPSLFLRHASNGVTVLLVYIDDIIIIGIDASMIKYRQYSLSDSFNMKDLGPLNYFLGFIKLQTAYLSINTSTLWTSLILLIFITQHPVTHCWKSISNYERRTAICYQIHTCTGD